jgi:alanyl-tRNA synthetase
VAGGPPGSPNEDGDRYIEIWNNVFMQFNRTEDGVMHKLPKPSVDTGMRLERITAVLQHVHSNYEIDLFAELIRSAQRAVLNALPVHVGLRKQGETVFETSDRHSDELKAQVPLTSPSLKVIADHIRTCTFAVVDGVIPGNAGRGYVLRRIARRAIRHGYKLGAREAFFYTLVPALVEQMGEAYPELRQGAARATEVLKQEEERFFQTIERGMEILETALAAKPAVLDGDTAFKLHDTYGFPVDLTADVCRERGLTVDQARFDELLERQKQGGREAGKFKMAQGLAYEGAPTTFHGYDELVHEGARSRPFM